MNWSDVAYIFKVMPLPLKAATTVTIVWLVGWLIWGKWELPKKSDDKKADTQPAISAPITGNQNQQVNAPISGGSNNSQLNAPGASNVTQQNNSGSIVNNGTVGTMNNYTVQKVSTGKIPGTETTTEVLDKFFPFGWIVCVGGDKRTFFPDTRDVIQWDIPLGEIVFEPDFAAGTASFTIPYSKIFWPARGSSIEALSESLDLPLKKGMGRPSQFRSIGQPGLHVVILSEDQRRPAFAFGFRIDAEPSEKQ